ncbi:hypothetical protein GALL_248690 [mine drainage metagenome]|uniref:Uncharacterized protein n=1 Tax=mine drainage metagenome TaxID=410659 RepID=A0A1J5RUM1_9ZZZZ
MPSADLVYLAHDPNLRVVAFLLGWTAAVIVGALLALVLNGR